jgi:uncharacterized Zn finger protein
MIRQEPGLCPFCNGSSELIRNADNWPVVQCDECGALGPSIELDPMKAVERWNERYVPVESRQPQENASHE